MIELLMLVFSIFFIRDMGRRDISNVQNDNIICPFSKLEIWDFLRSLGSDGYTVEFYQHYWEIVGGSLGFNLC